MIDPIPHSQPSAWQRLNGKVAPEVVAAPRTCGDTTSPQDWPQVHEIVVTYLERNVLGHPWADQLALMAAVFSAKKCDVQTVRGRLLTLHPRFVKFFCELGLETLHDWDPNRYLPRYLRVEIVSDDSLSMRVRFRQVYESCTHEMRRWSTSLPGLERERYQRFMLPLVSPFAVKGLLNGKQLLRQQQAARKQETDAVVPRFADLRAEAHCRYNQMRRLHSAYRQALQTIDVQSQQGDSCVLPFAFSYDEGGDPGQGIPAQERLHFRIWDRRSFVLAHPETYSPATCNWAKRGVGTFARERNGLFLEWVRAERLHDDAPVQGFWFAELLRRGIVGSSTLRLSQENQNWLRSWGYGMEGEVNVPSPFSSKNAALLGWVQKDAAFMHHAQKHTQGVLIPVEELYATTLFGLLAISVFTTTGMRINEAQQIRVSPDCLVRLAMPAPPGARDQSMCIRYSLRLIPKGERTETLHDFFIGPEVMRVLTLVAQHLCEHYGIESPQALPHVPFSASSGRAHRFGKAPYLFQYASYHLNHDTIVGCMRFLLHGMIFRTRDGQPVILAPHLLRHAFATHAVQVEKIPVDIVGMWLKQKNLDVTEYYSQVTETLLGEAADQFLARLAVHIDVGEAVRRSPETLQRLYEEARGKAGTLAEVIGGHCTMHGYCPAKFACIGCPAHVPDPAKRHQVERQERWGRKQIQMATEEGLYPEAERMRQFVRDCVTTRAEMDQIEAYRKDETRGITIHFDDEH